MNNRKPITLYVRGWNAAGQVKPFRRVLQNTFFAEQGNTIASRTGIVLNQSAFFQIFNDPDFVYIPFAAWSKLTETEYAGKWSIDIVSPQSFILPYISDYEFTFNTLSNITTAENAFINANGGKRIAVLEDNTGRGSKKVQHVFIRC